MAFPKSEFAEFVFLDTGIFGVYWETYKTGFSKLPIGQAPGFFLMEPEGFKNYLELNK